jgi:hypothetical protein
VIGFASFVSEASEAGPFAFERAAKAGAPAATTPAPSTPRRARLETGMVVSLSRTREVYANSPSSSRFVK